MNQKCEVKRASYPPIVWIRWISSLLGWLLISELCHLFHQYDPIRKLLSKVWLGKIWHFQTEQELKSDDRASLSFLRTRRNGMETMGQQRTRNGQGGGNVGNVNDSGPDPDAIKMFVGQVPRSMDEVSRLCFRINLFSPNPPFFPLSPFCSSFSMYLLFRRNSANSSANLVQFTSWTYSGTNPQEWAGMCAKHSETKRVSDFLFDQRVLLRDIL